MSDLDFFRDERIRKELTQKEGNFDHHEYVERMIDWRRVENGLPTNNRRSGVCGVLLTSQETLALKVLG